MKHIKNNWKILLGGLLLMAVSMYLEGYVLNLINTVNGPCGLGKIVLTDRVGPANEKNTRANLDDIKYLKRKLAGRRISYLVQQEGHAEGNQHTAPVKILGTDCQWVNFCALDFKKGGMWTPEAEQEGQRVTVIGSNLAHTLYGSDDVVGMPIGIEGKTFLINGVLSPRTGILNELTSESIPEIFIPGAALFDLSADSEIREIDIETPGMSSSSISEESDSILNGSGNLDAFTVFDYRQVLVLMEQVPKTQRFIIGIIVILVLLQLLKNRTQALLLELRHAHAELDFGQVLKGYGQQIGLHLGLSAVLVLVILLLWNLIRFTPYIPSDYVPDDLINISYFTEVIKLNVHAGQKMLENYQPHPEVELGLVRHVSRFFCYFIWPLGMAMVLYAWPKTMKESGDCQ